MLVQIFLYQTPVQPETLIYLEKEHFSYIMIHTPFFRQISIFKLLKNKEYLRIRHYYHSGKKYLH